MRGKEGTYLIVVCMGLALALLGFTSTADVGYCTSQSTVSELKPGIRNVVVAGNPHDPIVIDGDANFTQTAGDEGWPGDGSAGNPFIINGLDIDRAGVVGHCINITNTQVHFTISNCTLTGANSSLGCGIYLDTVDNGKIANNIIRNNSYSIYLYDSDYITI